MKFAIVFLGVFILNIFMVSATQDLFVDKITEKINENNLYLNFISESKYNTVKLISEDKVYYLKHNGIAVKIVEEIKKPDVVIGLGSEQFGTLIEAYENNNVKEFKKIIFGVLPFRVKFNVFFQCLKTDWCRKMIF